MSSKKWLIICGLCSSLLAVFVLLLLFSSGIEFNDYENTDSKTTYPIFGYSYEPPKGYAVWGVPVMDLKNVKNSITLTGSKDKLIILAVGLKESAANLTAIKDRNFDEVKAYLTNILPQMTRQGHFQTTFSELKVKTIESIKLTNGKTILLANAVNDNKGNKKSVSTPAVLALIPETNNELVILIVANGNLPLSKTNSHLNLDYPALQKVIKQIIIDSELDDRLVIK